MNQLELATTEELITELFNRATFLGVLVFSTDPHKFPNQVHERIEIRHSLPQEDAVEFLKIGINSIDR